MDIVIYIIMIGGIYERWMATPWEFNTGRAPHALGAAETSAPRRLDRGIDVFGASRGMLPLRKKRKNGQKNIAARLFLSTAGATLRK